jgi:uncharacterized membrane protein YeaQ/YmgE (transglycosylase-associated protein family)
LCQSAASKARGDRSIYRSKIKATPAGIDKIKIASWYQKALDLNCALRSAGRNGRKWGTTRRIAMGIISWIVIGLIAGFIGSKIVNRSGEGLIRDIILGIVGAFVGGWIFTAMGQSGVTGVNFYSIFVAVIGAIVVLVAYHTIAGQRATA